MRARHKEIVVPKVLVTRHFKTITVALSEKGFPVGGADMTQIVIEERTVWWLARMFVKKEYRLQGLGTEMFRKMVAVTDGIPIIVTPGGYDIEQAEQIQFYEKMGFVLQDEYMEYRQ